MKVNFTLRNERQEPIGTAALYVSTSTTLNPRSGEWSEENLPNKWGLLIGWPLTRSLDGDSRREYICGFRSTVAFVPKPDIVPDDSCDEFPFASTYQGGTDGAQCAEIVPLLENGKWEIYEADPARPVKYTEPCVRAHVTLPMNRLAGTAYTNLIQSQRLVEKDPFRMSVPDA